MDFTPGAMNNAQEVNFVIRHTRPMSLGTRCHQIAMYVVYESPLQMLCDNPSNYHKEAECTKFISQIPSVWDETIALEGKVGEYIAVARRKGKTWYVGAMTNWDEREMTLDLSFLTDGDHSIELIQDGINANNDARDYKLIKKTSVDKSLKIKLAKGGGWAAIIK